MPEHIGLEDFSTLPNFQQKHQRNFPSVFTIKSNSYDICKDRYKVQALVNQTYISTFFKWGNSLKISLGLQPAKIFSLLGLSVCFTNSLTEEDLLFCLEASFFNRSIFLLIDTSSSSQSKSNAA